MKKTVPVENTGYRLLWFSAKMELFRVMRNGRKNANHACMNEQFFLEFHMARSRIEMQRSGIEMWL